MMVKSTQTIKSSALAIALALSLMTGAAVAKGPHGHKLNAPHAPIERMIEKLDLTDEQIIQVEDLFDARKGSHAEKTQRKSEIRSLIDQGYIEQAAELAANEARERVYRMAEFNNGLSQILTSEQWAKMEQSRLRKQQRAERRKEKRTDDVSD